MSSTARSHSRHKRSSSSATTSTNASAAAANGGGDVTNLEMTRSAAVMALAVTIPEWTDLGGGGTADADTAAPTSIDRCTERLAALLLVRIVAIIAPPKHYDDYSTSGICRKALIESIPWWPDLITITVWKQLKQYVRRILQQYSKLPFHNFQHAYHVTVSANKLMDLILALDSNHYMGNRPPPSFGLRHDPISLMSLLFAALIHDVEHKGVSNKQLMAEDHNLALVYNDQSVNEHRSLTLAFEEFLKPDYADLRTAMFPDHATYRYFRMTVINAVLSTDLAGPDRAQITKSKWKEAFGTDYAGGPSEAPVIQLNAKAMPMMVNGNNNHNHKNGTSMPTTMRRSSLKANAGTYRYSRRGSNASMNSTMSDVTTDSLTRRNNSKQHEIIHQYHQRRNSAGPGGYVPPPPTMVGRRNSNGSTAGGGGGGAVTGYGMSRRNSSGSTTSANAGPLFSNRQRSHSAEEVLGFNPPHYNGYNNSNNGTMTITGGNSRRRASLDSVTSYGSYGSDFAQDSVVMAGKFRHAAASAYGGGGGGGRNGRRTSTGAVHLGNVPLTATNGGGHGGMMMAARRGSTASVDTFGGASAADSLAYHSQHVWQSQHREQQQQQQQQQRQQQLRRNSNSLSPKQMRRNSTTSYQTRGSNNESSMQSYMAESINLTQKRMGGQNASRPRRRCSSPGAMDVYTHMNGLSHDNGGDGVDGVDIRPPLTSRRSWNEGGGSSANHFNRSSNNNNNNNNRYNDDGYGDNHSNPHRNGGNGGEQEEDGEEDEDDSSLSLTPPSSGDEWDGVPITGVTLSRSIDLVFPTRRRRFGSGGSSSGLTGGSGSGNGGGGGGDVLLGASAGGAMGGGRDGAVRPRRSSLTMGPPRTMSPSHRMSRRASTGNVPMRFNSTAVQRIEEEEPSGMLQHVKFVHMPEGTTMNGLNEMEYGPSMHNASTSPSSARYRKRLGIRRSMDLSGESIEVYSRHSTTSSFGSDCDLEDTVADEPDELRATVVLELLLRAADVAHSLQGWENMSKWNELMFMELAAAHRAGRGFDPVPGWFDNQIRVMESYLTPLALRLDDTGIFGEFLGAIFHQNVVSNKDRWMIKGMDATAALRDEAARVYPMEDTDADRYFV